ncbi:hypothetical protein [Marinimicrobium locisalis]|uniref:hypothetical protein n=1 Tax=Marinimicrobium locisalis TaxID=546022 RepID=UPI0032216C24
MKRAALFSSATLGAMLAIGLPGPVQAQKEGEEFNKRNPVPEALFITPWNEKELTVSARFPNHRRGTELNITINGETLTLRDDGEKGDREPEDGLFSRTGTWDIEHFIKANHILAETTQKVKRPLFAPGGRERIGTQANFVEGEQLIIEQSLGEEKRKRFFLPLSPDRIEFERPIEIPVLGPPIGIPLDPIRSGTVEPMESLMITKLNVVNDPERTWFCSSTNQPPSGNPVGPWTFWTLMDNMNNGTSSTSEFIKQMFEHWNTNQIVNDHSIAARPHVYQEVIEAWEQRSGGQSAPLQPDESPFRLLGIVNRSDLGGNTSAYGGGGAGEGRFVFSLHDGDCNTMGKTLILEYKVPINSCPEAKEWARAWINLESSPTYNDDLQALTDVFASADANPFAPNGSAISQVRTNEFLAASPLWEMREFRLPESGGFLKQVTTKREPQSIYNNTTLLAEYINANWQALVAQTHVIPEDFNSANDFLAGSAPTPQLWNASAAALTVPPSEIDDALFGLGLNTCSGCHQIETGTNFAHLHYNTQPGQPAILSGFLTGTSLPDPRNASITHQFGDLAMRANKLEELASQACRTIRDLPVGNALVHELTRNPPLRAVH